MAARMTKNVGAYSLSCIAGSRLFVTAMEYKKSRLFIYSRIRLRARGGLLVALPLGRGGGG